MVMNKNNEIEKTDRNEIIRRHRAVWNWIADWFEETPSIYKGAENAIPMYLLSILKGAAVTALYPKDKGRLVNYGYCYLCFYAQSNCDNCPLYDQIIGGTCLNGRYIELNRILTCEKEGVKEKATALAREIADLPEVNKEGLK